MRWVDADVCLAHLDSPAMKDALTALRPGDDIDLRGTSLTSELLDKLLSALTPGGEDARPEVGDARFDRAQFNNDAVFRKICFSGAAVFSGARFDGNAQFDEAQFGERARFEEVKFKGGAAFTGANFGERAMFTGAQFDRAADFNGARFVGYAGFDGVQFSKTAAFEWAEFDGNAGFKSAQFAGQAWFKCAKFGLGAHFEKARFNVSWFGPVVCQGGFWAQEAVFARAVRLEIVAPRMDLTGASFAAPAVFAIRFASVNLDALVTASPLRVTWQSSPFTYSVNVGTRRDIPVDELALSGDPRPAVVSLSGTDAANIVLSDVDLSRCVFSGAHNLDQIRLEGHCLFASAPPGWSWGRALIPVRRWTRRKLLAEEVSWRADPDRPALARVGWIRRSNLVASPVGFEDRLAPAASPAQLAVLYRQLRKALEDGKDMPGAADFYYGEMEARRHDVQGTPRGERALLHAYWLMSGYALRASRALGFLAVTAAVTFLLMMAFGLPDNQLDPQIIGTAPAPGGRTVLTESTPDPALTLPLGQRFTAARADKAALVVVNSVVFRSAGATLTGSGTWIELVSRIGEPVLLGFAAVAARGRVQR